MPASSIAARDDRLITVPILREYYCIAVPFAHRLAREPFVCLTGLAGETLIWLRGGRGGSFNAGARELLAAAGVQIGGSIEASDTECCSGTQVAFTCTSGMR